jgi:signal transduction histidine kinase/ActR/RegA family two-component response regulator
MHPKQLIIALTFLGSCLTTNAQVNIDSLKIIWSNPAVADSVRLTAVHSIAWDGFRFQNPDSAFFYAQLELDLAESMENMTAIAMALNTQGDALLLKGQPDEALATFTRVLDVIDTVYSPKPEIITLTNIARVYDAKGDYIKSLDYYLEVLKLIEDSQDTTEIGKTLGDIGKNYVRTGDYVTGLEYLYRAKKTFEKQGVRYNEITIQSIIASIYTQQGNLDEALSLFEINLAYFEEIDNQTLMGGALSNIAAIYAQRGENKKAAKNLEQAIFYFKSTGNIPYLANLTMNLAGIYYAVGNLERALELTIEGMNLGLAIKNENLVATAKTTLSKILFDQAKYNEAITYGTEALLSHEKTGNLIDLKETTESLTKNYKAVGNYQKALEMNERYHQMDDSLNSTANQQALIELKVQSDYDKQKALDDFENEKEIAIEEQKTEAQIRISIAVGIGLVLISILAIIIFSRLKLTRKQKLIIEEQKKKVEQSEKYKQQFLANMSHEIRTPMHAISGMTKILERNPHPKQQDVYLKAITTSSDNLVVILNDVLDLSKIEAGKLEIENISMNLELILENVIQILKFKAEEKGLVLSYRISTHVPVFAMGDPTRLNQILINLVGNAIKFTDKGKVELLVQLKNNQLHFQVKDTGIGIPVNKQNTIFGAFEQATVSTNRYYGGTGLGLSISKQLVELQNGKIGVQSTEGVGSTFFFELPLTIPEESSESQKFVSKEKLTMMTNSLKGIRVLIAEDNPFNQMIAQDDLAFFIEGIQLVTVENGAMAIEKFKTEPFDIILMDVQMPQMNGFEATKAIREIEQLEGRTSPIPVIAMTASLLKTEIDSCFSAGMNNYIPKPYKLEELIVPLYTELKPQ